MYTPPGAKRGHSDWNVSNCILPTWLPSSMTISMGGTDSTSSSQNSGSSWLPIQIDVLWSSSSPGNQQKKQRKTHLGTCFVTHPVQDWWDWRFTRINYLQKIHTKMLPLIPEERAAIHTSDTETRPKIRLETEKEGISRNVTDNDKLFWRRQSSSAVSITSIYEVILMLKGSRAGHPTSNPSPKTTKPSINKIHLAVWWPMKFTQKLMLTKSMVPLGFPQKFSAGGVPHADHRDLMVIQKTRWTSPGYRCLTGSGGMLLKFWWNWTSQWSFRWSTSAPAFHICKEPPLATPISSKCAFLPRKCCKCLW